jgi:hypothetical protein
MRIEPASRSPGPRWPILAGMLLIALLIAGTLQHEGARTVLVSWRAHLASVVPGEMANDVEPQAFQQEPAEEPEKEPIAAEAEDELPALPAPDQHGVVRLKGSGPYRARTIAAVGALTIVAEGPTFAEIVIRNTPLQLTAETVRIENVHLRHETKTSSRGRPRPALVLVQAQTLQLERCLLMVSELPPVSEKPVDVAPPTKGIGLGWKLVDGRDPQGGVATFRNTILVGGDCGIEFSDPVRRIEFSNCLRLTGGPLGQFAVSPAARNETIVRLERTTCRAAAALFRLARTEGPAPRGRISIEANDCVLDLLHPDGCLFELMSNSVSEGTPRIKLTGEGSLAPETLVTTRRQQPLDEARLANDAPEIPVEGILAGPYRFTGTLSLRPADAEVHEYDAPRRSTIPPGIDAAMLPGG